MVKRLFAWSAALLCLLPLVYAGVGDAWTTPWRSAELDACVGTYQLPSGVVLHVERQGNALFAGEPRREMRRSAAWYYLSKGDPLRLRFHADGRAPAFQVDVSGISPRMQAVRVASAEAGSARMVDVGGFRLRLNVVGRRHSGPTVILETGPLGGLEGVAQWQADVGEFACVVAYDHAGSGGSDAGPEPQTAAAVAIQLRRALRELAIAPPYVVAGMSMGGPYSTVFAHHFPGDVAGLVWIDPTPDWDDLYRWCDQHAPHVGKKVRRSMQWIDLSLEKRLGSAKEPGRQSEWDSMNLTWEEVRAGLPLKQIPVIQVTGAKDFAEREAVRMKVRYFDTWLTQHVEQTEHVLAKKSGHGVYATEPQLVLDAIRRLVELDTTSDFGN